MLDHTDRFGIKNLLHSAALTSNRSFFSTNLFPKFAWPLPCQLQDVQQVAWWIFAYPTLQWRELSPHFQWTERKLAGLDEDHSPIPCLPENARPIGGLVYDPDSHHRTHFSDLGSLPWQFSLI